MKIEPGKYVEYSYKLYNDADGSLLFETPEKAPDVMIYGTNREVVPGLLHALEGLQPGDRFEVTLPAEAAFGMPSEDFILTLDKSIFERDGKLADEVKVGAMLPMMTAEGFQVRGKVLEIGDKEIKMDFNHPFAGLTVRYNGEVNTVRDATPDEISAAQGGCGGCGGGCCSDGGGCGCESGGCGECDK